MMKRIFRYSLLLILVCSVWALEGATDAICQVSTLSVLQEGAFDGPPL